MDVSRFRHRASVTVAAPPEAVWARVIDVTRMGEASPVCTGCDWDDPATGFAEGAWFTGHNEEAGRVWSTRCKVVDVVPGRSFAFVNHGNSDVELVRWGYEVEPAEGGTVLSETWQVLPDYPDHIGMLFPELDLETMLTHREQTTRVGMAATIAAIKTELEGTTT
jgi:carbon monoxide dehydrogenase subunit G